MPRLTRGGWAYVIAVGCAALVGFATDSTMLIVLAALAALPASVLAVPAYYVAFGVLAQLPGADTATVTGSVSCGPAGQCQESSAGDPAAWFTLATDAVGILALTAAALVNVVVLRRLAGSSRAPGPPRPAAP